MLRRKQRSSLWTLMLVLVTCGPATQTRWGRGRRGSVHMVPGGDLVIQAEWVASSELLLHRKPCSPVRPLEPTPTLHSPTRVLHPCIFHNPLLPKGVNQKLIRRFASPGSHSIWKKADGERDEDMGITFSF